MRRSDSIRFPDEAVFALAYLAGALLLLPLFRHEINPDGISYLSIAKYYSHGDWGHAINGYWGPLISWLLVPFLRAGIEPLLADKLLSILIGVFATILTVRFFRSFCLSIVALRIAMTAVVMAYWQFTFQIFTPDLLMVLVLVAYWRVVLDPGFGQRLRDGVVAGALGALAYFTKAYGLYFFVGHYTALFVLRTWAASRRGRGVATPPPSGQRGVGEIGTDVAPASLRQSARVWALGMLTCAILASPWVALLSDKYGGVTVATTGRFNHAIVAPGSLGQPMLYRGFMAPPHELAVAVWEDPSSIPVRDWRVLESLATMRHMLRLLLTNLGKIEGVFKGYSRLYLVILCVFMFWILGDPRRSAAGLRGWLILATMLIYLAGYALLAVEVRYIYPCIVLLFLVAGLVLTRFLGLPGQARLKRGAVSALFLLSTMYLPGRYLAMQAGRNEGIFELSRSMQALQMRGRLASNANWHDSLYLAYHLGLRYYGQQGTLPQERVPGELRSAGVDYYLVWNEKEAEKEQFAGCPDLLEGANPSLRVYLLSADSRGG